MLHSVKHLNGQVIAKRINFIISNINYYRGLIIFLRKVCEREETHLSLGRGQGQKDGEDGGHPLARSGQVGDQNQTD